MSADDVKNFMGNLWYRDEDGIITIGISEDAIEEFESIVSIDLPSEQEEVEEDMVVGSIETDDGPIDLYSPVAGTVIEINSAALEDSSLIMEDPYEEGWLIKIEASEAGDDEDEDEDDEDDDDDDYDEDEGYDDED